MTAILFYSFLPLIILWLLLGIMYLYMIFSSPYEGTGKKCTKDRKGQKEAPEKQHEGSKNEFVLIGKTRSISPVFPKIPASSSSEKAMQINHNFAQTDDPEEEKIQAGEEENEMDVLYEMEETDENDIAREEMGMFIEAASDEAEVSTGSILARDLARLQKWSHSDGDADEEEIRDTVSRLDGSDLMEKYKENIERMQGKQAELLKRIRKAEEQNGRQPGSTVSTEPASGENTGQEDEDDRPLSYYL